MLTIQVRDGQSPRGPAGLVSKEVGGYWERNWHSMGTLGAQVGILYQQIKISFWILSIALAILMSPGEHSLSLLSYLDHSLCFLGLLSAILSLKPFSSVPRLVCARFLFRSLLMSVFRMAWSHRPPAWETGTRGL